MRKIQEYCYQDIKKGDIIKNWSGWWLFVTSASNQGVFRCKDKHGRLIWASFESTVKIANKEV